MILSECIVAHNMKLLKYTQKHGILVYAVVYEENEVGIGLEKVN